MPWLLGIVVLLAGLLGYAATKPKQFRVQRATRIKAPASKVFSYLDDFHRWSVWSPWEKLDPALQRTYSGPERGMGAVYAWEGNRKVGKGRMEIIDVAPPSKLTVKLNFLAPFEAQNTAEFSLSPDGDGTEVTWAMYGPSPLLMRAMGAFMDMDKSIGKDFESGLANLKAAAEA